MFKFWKKTEKEDSVNEEFVSEDEKESLAEEEQELNSKIKQEENLDLEDANLRMDTGESAPNDLESEMEDLELKSKADEDINNENIDTEEELSNENSMENLEETEEFDTENNGNEKPEIEKKNIFSRLLEGLSKTKDNITGRIDSIIKSYTKIDEDLMEELEEVLITADVGMNTTMYIVDELKNLIKERGIKDPLEVRNLLKEVIESILSESSSKIDIEPGPAIIVMVGVNGVGKTTTIGKLAKRYKDDGKKVVLAAADTFRAAATEQLDIWAKRVNVDIIKHHEGADPGAVIFDAISASKARKADVLICDTAGRLHNKSNLMNELGKIFKIIDREYPEAKREVLLVVDATTGQNAVSQAKTFKEVANITGIVLTKLDGTAKGGVVLAVKSEVDVPVKLIGVGERVEDLQDFDAQAFTEAIFSE
ncbi:signal recognition particle-docking protein FtsY [Peptostreptococcus faecalis]|uniref:signal recognition particle-docking protein FtsY n=1 Tax=Peptostreptococcus faecalis TaxID=2045015 RepID=UPI000C7C7A9D|nr:signal recognition particle-docking protein FtsY [Peptostreptococcus faecalis]